MLKVLNINLNWLVGGDILRLICIDMSIQDYRFIYKKRRIWKNLV